MTLQGLRKTVTAGLASTGMAVALMFGFGPATANADVLDQLAAEFSTAAGAGQVANLLNESLKLRAMGFKPTKGELSAIEKALEYRPNQTPLTEALQAAVDGQTKRYQQAQASGQSPFTIGINQYDPNNPGGFTAGPGGINLGGGAHTIGDGRAPGQVVGPPRG